MASASGATAHESQMTCTARFKFVAQQHMYRGTHRKTKKMESDACGYVAMVSDCGLWVDLLFSDPKTEMADAKRNEPDNNFKARIPLSEIIFKVRGTLKLCVSGPAGRVRRTWEPMSLQRSLSRDDDYCGLNRLDVHTPGFIVRPSHPTVSERCYLTRIMIMSAGNCYELVEHSSDATCTTPGLSRRGH
jgi:hypothetical protein